MTSRVIAVAGSSPGIGKSTLCRALVARLRGRGVTVDHFEESEILTRPSFEAVARQFGEGSGAVRPEALVESVGRYLATADSARADVVVTDALLPFVHSLVAWGYDEPEISAFLADLQTVMGQRPVTLVYLRDEPAVALPRAIEREEPGWAEWFVNKLHALPGSRRVHDLESAAEHLREEMALTDRLLRRTNWMLLDVEVGGRTPEQTFRLVCEGLTGMAIRRTGL